MKNQNGRKHLFRRIISVHTKFFFFRSCRSHFLKQVPQKREYANRFMMAGWALPFLILFLFKKKTKEVKLTVHVNRKKNKNRILKRRRRKKIRIEEKHNWHKSRKEYQSIRDCSLNFLKIPFLIKKIVP